MKIISRLKRSFGISSTQNLMPEEKELIEASDSGNLQRVKELLEKGINPDAVSVTGDNTALIYAADSGNIEIAKILLNFGANVNYQGETDTALTCAVVIGSKELVTILLNAGADPNLKGNYSSTPLGYAVHYGHEEIIDILKQQGAKE